MDAHRADTAEFQPRHLVLHLWNRRWLILLLPVIAFEIAWLAASARRTPTFESRAAVLLRAPARISAEDRTPIAYNPPAFRRMFTADATLDRVRQSHGSTESIEAWRGRFTANTSTEIDNTVATEYAPLVDLRVRAGTAAEAVTLMNLWTEVLLEEYGDLYAEEARAASERAVARAAELVTQYAEAAAEEEGARLRHQSAAARAEAIVRLMDGLPPASRLYLPDTLAPYGFTAGAEATISAAESAVEETPSLYLTRTLGELRNLSNEEQLAAIRALQEKAWSESATAAGQLASAAARRLRLEHALRANASAAAQAETRLPLDDATASPHGTLRILSPSVEPGGTMGRGPHVTALIAALLILALTLSAFAAEAYVRFSVKHAS
jgi:hypothetical protein